MNQVELQKTVSDYAKLTISYPEYAHIPDKQGNIPIGMNTIYGDLNLETILLALSNKGVIEVRISYNAMQVVFYGVLPGARGFIWELGKPFVAQDKYMQDVIKKVFEELKKIEESKMSLE